MTAADRTRRLLVTMAVAGGALLMSAAPAFAGHATFGFPDNENNCHFVDSSMADVEDGPVDADTDGWYGCAIPGEGGGGGGGGERAVGDIGAGEGDIVPAARIDAGAGGAATGGNPALLAGVITGATGAIGAVVARRRR